MTRKKSLSNTLLQNLCNKHENFYGRKINDNNTKKYRSFSIRRVKTIRSITEKIFLTIELEVNILEVNIHN